MVEVVKYVDSGQVRYCCAWPGFSTPTGSREFGGTGNLRADQRLWPALGCILFVSEAPPCLLAKETQEMLAENAVPCCPAEMTTLWRAREEGGEK